MLQDQMISAIASHLVGLFGRSPAFEVDFSYEWKAPENITADQIWRMVDLTLLKPEATRDDIHAVCKKAIEHKAATVCVNPIHIGLATDALYHGSTRPDIPRPSCVVGFPLGACREQTLAAETADAIGEGAREIDMVLPVGHLKGRHLITVYRNIKAVVDAARASSEYVAVKVIQETCHLADEEIVMGCLISRYAGADFVKTSTGFGSAGAKVEHVALMRRVVGPAMGVKASGGVGDTDKALAMIRAGASRIGASRMETPAALPATGSY